MYVFIWKRLSGLTSNYHSSGGLVVIASDLDAAIKLCREDKEIPQDCELFGDDPLVPTARLQLTRSAGFQPKVYVFEDAGCC